MSRTIRKASSSIGSFARSEDGNATIDWTVFLGGLVGLTLAVMALIGGGLLAFSERAEVERSARIITRY